MTLLIYVEENSERLRYTFELIFSSLLGLKFELTQSREDFRSFEGSKLSYSKKPLGEELHFFSTPLLFERSIQAQRFTIIRYKGNIGFYSTSPSSAMPFDPFAASFYLVSRYEEYLPFFKDAHNRFPPEESLAYEHQFMQKPIVNIWSKEIARLLKDHFPALPIKMPKYKFIPTYDIDMPWSYRHKGILRSLGGYYRSLVSLEFREIWDRSAALMKLHGDPYYTFPYLYNLQEKHKLDPIYFMLVGDFDEFDKNPSYKEPAFQKLLKEIADYAKIGWHPSYASNYNRKKLDREKTRLEEILKRNICRSRQHYLMLEFPRTYQNLIDLHIKEDHTLGYTSQVGFRAGICTPFYFYNLHLELKSKLLLYPFAIMDATMQYYQKLKPGQVFDAVKPVIDEVKAVDGHLITLWHNNSFSEQKEWKGWRKPYEAILEYAVKPL